VDPRAGLEDLEKRKFLTLPGLELRLLVRPARSQSLYRLRFMVQGKFYFYFLHISWLSNYVRNLTTRILGRYMHFVKPTSQVKSVPSAFTLNFNMFTARDRLYVKDLTWKTHCGVCYRPLLLKLKYTIKCMTSGS
jgi:hypothetical protein